MPLFLNSPPKHFKMSTWGILRDRHLDTVPGTALLDDLKNKDMFDGVDTSKLKKHGDIILVPQPSDVSFARKGGVKRL